VAGFKAAFANEMYKLLKKRKIITAAVLSILAVLVGQAAVTVIKMGFGLRMAGSGEFPLVVLPLFSYTLLPLFAAFVAIDMFSGEYASNTMKLTLTRPVSRFGVFCAKAANLAVFIMGNLLFVMILSMITGFLFNSSSAGIMEFVRVVCAYVATFFPVFVFSLLVVLLANILRSGSAVFFLSILVYIAFHFIGIVFSSFSSFLITSMFDWYTLWISETFNFSKIIREFLIMAGCGTMLFAAGFYLFDRREL
jgi:ABC-2 type transport system permease protein